MKSSGGLTSARAADQARELACRFLQALESPAIASHPIPRSAMRGGNSGRRKSARSAIRSRNESRSDARKMPRHFSAGSTRPKSPVAERRLNARLIFSRSALTDAKQRSGPSGVYNSCATRCSETISTARMSSRSAEERTEDLTSNVQLSQRSFAGKMPALHQNQKS